MCLIFICSCSTFFYRHISEINLKNAKVTLVKNLSNELQLVYFKDFQTINIPMNRKLEVNGDYVLDNVKISKNITIIELFRREAGLNSSIGFLYSFDFNKNFMYVDFKEIDSDAESINNIKINQIDHSIQVSLYSLDPKGYFTSIDSCQSWVLHK